MIFLHAYDAFYLSVLIYIHLLKFDIHFVELVFASLILLMHLIFGIFIVFCRVCFKWLLPLS